MATALEVRKSKWLDSITRVLQDGFMINLQQ